MSHREIYWAVAAAAFLIVMASLTISWLVKDEMPDLDTLTAATIIAALVSVLWVATIPVGLLAYLSISQDLKLWRR